MTIEKINKVLKKSFKYYLKVLNNNKCLIGVYDRSYTYTLSEEKIMLDIYIQHKYSIKY